MIIGDLQHLKDLMMTKLNDEQITNLSEYLVNGMSYQELYQFVFDDLYHVMSQDQEVAQFHLDQLDLTPEQFLDRNFKNEV